MGNWLFGVARNTALKARAMNQRRRTKEQKAAAQRQPEAPPATESYVHAVLDEELHALPAKYRAAIVLCDLEGKSLKEASRHLGCPPKTVSTWLARGRKRLAERLARRGLALAGGAIVALLGQNAASAGVPAALLASTIKTARLLAAGQALSAVVGAKVAALTEGVIKTMLLAKLKVTTTGVLGWGDDAASALEPPTFSVSQRLEIPLGLDPYMPVPEQNPLTADKIALGRRLFAEPLLSRDRRLSCAGCHDPGRAFSDAKPVAVGVFGRKGTRNVPTLINRGYGISFFWDGRASSLEKQVLQPIQDPKEMDMTIADVVARLKEKKDYPKLFQAAFGRDVNAEDLARTLASYVRTILSGESPYDRYVNGAREALSAEARQGLDLFRGKAHCTACHVGPNLTDEGFHNTGVAWHDGRLLDPGRFAVTGKEADRGAFKTPTLREVARTAPYMHDGSLATLEEVIDYYNRGGNRNPHLDAELRPLHLTAQEKQALEAFLRALSGTIHEGG